jgi:hypothetical protein
MMMEGLVGSALVAVLISSLITILGLIITFRNEHVREAERRRERIEDIQTALMADIKSTANRLSGMHLDQHIKEINVLVSGGPSAKSYTPFVPREPGSLLWPSVAGEVHILPNEVIEPVVIFFGQLERIRMFVEDLRTYRFAGLEADRKIGMLRDYIQMTEHLVHLAGEAQHVLAKSLKIKLPVQTPTLSGSDRLMATESASPLRAS